MKITEGLNEIKRILVSFNSNDEVEKLKRYSVIVAIFSRLDRFAEDDSTTSNYNQYKEELLLSIESMCGLDDGNGNTKEKHLLGALGAVRKLESENCFKR